jgi:ferric-dicitrate binding protein FerR (iron transport regulator)
MDQRRDRQKRQAWLRGIVAALVLVVLLACAVSLLWIVPVFEDDGDPSGGPGSQATPMVMQTATP